MTDAVLRSTEGRIGILTVNNPPVNALAAAVRDGIKEGVEAFGKDANIDAIVLIGGGRTFIAGAVAHAQLLVAQKAPRRRVRDRTATLESPDLFKETEKAIARRARGFKAPWSIIKCVQAAVELPFDEGMKRERELFVELLTSQ